MSFNWISKNSDFIVQQVKVKKKLFQFLKEVEVLAHFKKDCWLFLQKYQDKKTEAFLVNINLNFNEIEDANILYLITREPKHFQVSLEEVLSCSANSFFEENGVTLKIVEAQIHCNIRLQNLPLISSFAGNFFSVHPNRALSTFRCCFVEKSPVATYVRQTVWKCFKCVETNNIIRRANRREHESVHCENCLGLCHEIVALRSTSSSCSARVLEAGLLEKSSRHQLSFLTSIKLIFFDDLCQDYQLGKNYIVTGIFESFDSYLVWNIKLCD